MLEAEHSKRQILVILNYIRANQKRFNELLQFALGNDEELARRAYLSIAYCVEDHPKLARKHLKKIIRKINHPIHHAVRRGLLRLLLFSGIPVSLESNLRDACFEVLHHKEETIASKMFAADSAEKVRKKYPELYSELVSILEAGTDLASPGIKSVIRTIKRNKDKFSKE